MNEVSKLEDDISAAFSRACCERDWLVAEFLFQALEAIAQREGEEVRVDAALDELLREFSAKSQ